MDPSPPPALPERPCPPPLAVAYLESARLAEALADGRVLAAIRFGSQTRRDETDARLLTVGLPELGGRATVEVWHAQRPPLTGTADGIRFACTESLLFAYTLLDEADFPDLDTAAHAAYRRILTFVRQRGYPHLLRVWNYFSAINGEQNGLERYRAFCQGRYRALTEALADSEPTLPAACAIGTQAPGFLIYFLAAAEPGVQIENPRQTSAFRYPPQYGPASPSFSRATLKHWGRRQSHLYISGTASIIGHATRHDRDLPGQLRETLTNLQALLASANRHSPVPLHFALLKVYLRSACDPGDLAALIREQLGPAIPMVFLQGDICRRDLLMEIEGLAAGPASAP